MKKYYPIGLMAVLSLLLFFNCKNDDASLPVDDGPPEQVEDPNPDILNFHPAIGMTGIQVTLKGVGFAPEPNGNTVHFNGVPALVESASETLLVVTVPEEATTGKITVGAHGHDYTSFQDFTVLPPFPIIGDLEPKTGVEGDEVTITGEYFGDDASIVEVFFNGSTIPSEIKSISDTELVVTVTNAFSGPVEVSVHGQSTLSEGDFIFHPWRQMKDFEHQSRRFAATGAIGDDYYIGLGLESLGNNLSDFWKYSLETDTWTQLANFPGVVRYGAFHFVLNGLFYVGGGTDDVSETGPNDFYRFDPITNTWTQLDDFPGNPNQVRQHAATFTCNGLAYVYAGYPSHINQTLHNDLWEYNPETDTWKEKAGFEPSGRAGAVAFSINGKGYVTTGIDIDDNVFGDVWEYDPITNSWTEKEPLPGGFERYGASGFTVQSKGYVGLGIDSEYNLLRDFWVFDPSGNGGDGSWTKKSDFPAEDRYFPIAIANDYKAIIGLGLGQLGYLSGYLSDIWEYTPRHDE